MVGLSRGASSCLLAHVCAILIVSKQCRQNRERSEFQPTSVCFLQEPCEGVPFPVPSSSRGLIFPALAAVLGPLPSQGLYFPHMVGGQLEKSSPGSVASPAHVTPAQPPASWPGLSCRPCDALTKDPFLQTGSFDTFTESADLLTCGRGHVIPQIPHL